MNDCRYCANTRKCRYCSGTGAANPEKFNCLDDYASCERCGGSARCEWCSRSKKGTRSAHESARKGIL